MQHDRDDPEPKAPNPVSGPLARVLDWGAFIGVLALLGWAVKVGIH